MCSVLVEDQICGCVKLDNSDSALITQVSSMTAARLSSVVNTTVAYVNKSQLLRTLRHTSSR